jgi:hypothetical protein
MTKEQEQREKILTFLRERIKAGKGRFIKTWVIAEAVNLNNHQVGNLMGNLTREDISDMKVTRWASHCHSGGRGSTWEVVPR